MKPWVPSLELYKLGMVVATSNPSSQVVEARSYKFKDTFSFLGAISTPPHHYYLNNKVRHPHSIYATSGLINLARI